MEPGQTCRFGASIAVIKGLLRKPSRLFPPYRWPGRTPTSTLVRLVSAAFVVMVVGAVTSNQAVTCGGQQMRPGDELSAAQ